MIETISTIISLIWFFGSVVFILIFSMTAEQNNKTTLQELKNLTIELFDNKNWFGILLSVFVCIVLIPSYIFALIIEVICMFCKVLIYIWKLGKKEK